MKRLILTIAAVASVAGPMAVVATDAAAQNRGDQRYSQRDNRQDYRNDNRGGRQDDRNDNRNDRNDRNGGRYDNRNDGRYDNRGGYSQQRWDNNRYNGYYYNNRWSYGTPPAAYYGRPGFNPGYQSWRRGGYLPQSYRSYVVRDYGRYGLRAPPRGYYWYQSGNDYLLAAIATGLIFDIVTR